MKWKICISELIGCCIGKYLKVKCGGAAVVVARSYIALECIRGQVMVIRDMLVHYYTLLREWVVYDGLFSCLNQWLCTNTAERVNLFGSL